MKLYYLLALDGLHGQRTPVADECDRAHLPDIEHGEWYCLYNGEESDQSHPEKCTLVCNGGYEYDYSGRTESRCFWIPRKQKYMWTPRRANGISHCVPSTQGDCDNVPTNAVDLEFFLLTNEHIYGTDGYSDDNDDEAQFIFSGRIPIPPTIQSTNEWMMMIDFGEHVDISGVEFETVNSIVADQTKRYLILRHREYNGDISQVGSIDVQGVSYDPAEAASLVNLSNSGVVLFPEYYWDYQCVTFPQPMKAYCDVLWETELDLCLPGVPMTIKCLEATQLRKRICGSWTSSESEAEGDEDDDGSGAEGSGASGPF